MALADFIPERTTIMRGETPLFDVRGLSLDDVSVLVRAHSDSLNLLVTMAGETDSAFGSAAFFMQAVTTAPNVAFAVIALAADEPQYSADARKLPAGVQIKALQEITRLTLEDIGGPKALVALVRNLLNQKKSLPQAGTATIQ